MNRISELTTTTCKPERKVLAWFSVISVVTVMLLFLRFQ
jgi:hypothetical protein